MVGVVVGHRIPEAARLLVSNDDVINQALTDINPNTRQKLLSIPTVQARFKMQALPEVGRMVLISAPLRGTDYADRWFTKVVRKTIRLPKTFAENIIAGTQGLSQDEKLLDAIHQLPKGTINNGPDDLSQASAFNRLTQNIHIEAGLPFHSIMGNITSSNDPAKITDGIVPYQSAHLEGAESEKIIKGGHSIQETPEAVLELRRILRLHLDNLHDTAVSQPQPKT